MSAVSMQKKSVLVIEDNVLNLDMACELLDLAGFETHHAEDATTGIELARKVMPDLILMDLHMPHRDGFMATKTLKADEQLKHIPIIAFTALAMREDQEKALAYGCSGIISKPIDVTLFAKTIEGYLMPGETSSADLAQYTRDRSSSSQFSYMSSGLRYDNEPVKYNSTEVLQNLERVQESDTSSHVILVVDDNPMNVELLKDALESMGQQVIPSYSGAEALDIVSHTKPHMILLDIMMPDMDGYAVLDKLQENPDTADIPVIFVSALNKTTDLVRGLKQGTYDYITKPFKVEEVKARILASLRIKDLQDTVQREKNTLGAVFEYSADALALLTPNLEVVSANPVFAKWFHLELNPDHRPLNSVQLFDLIDCQCQHGYPCPVHAEKPVLLDFAKPEETFIENAVIPDAVGQPRYLSIHAGSLLKSRSMSGLVVVLRDITREKTIEQSKETFVATLTHDLKTPIRAEFQALELLKAEAFGELTEDQQEIIREITQSNRYMSRLVDSLLATYKYDDGKMELKTEVVNLNELIQGEIYPALKTLADTKQQQFLLELSGDLKLVNVDPIEMQRVVNNLVQNAFTYTPKGGVITLKTLNQGEDRICVQIQDTGPGIEPENQKVLFDRYKSMAKKFQQVGTGLGLYLSKMIVEAHGGELGLESELDKGSMFYFTLESCSPELLDPAV